MHIGLIFDHLDPRRGGAEGYLTRLLRELARRHRVTLYCQSAADQDPAVEVRILDVRRRGRGAREREFADRASGQAREDGVVCIGVRHVVDIDLYHPHGGTHAAAAEASLQRLAHPWQRWLRREFRRLPAKHRYFRWADEAVFASHPGRATLAVSEMVKDDILARYGAHRPAVRVLWPAIDEAFLDRDRVRAEGAAFRQKLGRSGGIMLLFVASNFALKGLDVLLEALPQSRIWREQAQLYVVGRGRVSRRQRWLMERAGAARVHLVPATPRVLPYFGAADLLVHPTWYDPCALTCLEAVACGLPVVTTDRNGAAPWVEQAGGQVVAAGGPAAGLARAIDQAAARPIGARGSSAEQLGWRHQLERYEQCLQELPWGIPR